MPNKNQETPSSNIEYATTDIAIVGLSARLPGASNVNEFWANLYEGKESIVDISESDLIAAGVTDKILSDPNYVKRAPILRGVEWFDAAFFGLNPNEAAVMDPQHRLFLECGWHALEDAGYDPATFKGPIGVFGGSGYNAYMTYHLARNQELLDSMGFFLLRHTGNDKDFLTTRLSYCLNLTGPSVNVQTACSTSLVAIHLAAQSLINYECDMALAGGVTIELPLNHGYKYSPGEIYSPDGHCRAFDADSQGTVFGSGCGIVVLRRLEDALEDGDNIRAIVKGSAINNDGAGKVGYLAPSVEGQAKAILEALEFSDVDPETVTYIETHGTGTSVGDPIEVSALTAAYGSKTDKKQYCGIGSVKSNIGHLDTAAGVASIIKATMAMEHKTLPASLHYKSPNPEIDFESTPFYVNSELNHWNSPEGQPRRAGVSSLGVGGTNAHIILEEAPIKSESSESRETQLIILSAKNETSLQSASDNLVDFLENNEEPLADIAYTLQLGRHHFENRKAIICRSKKKLIERLDADKDPMLLSGESKQKVPPIAFTFTGQGAQYVGMAKQLYKQESKFRELFDHCAELLLDSNSLDIKALILEADPDDAACIERINQTENTQPCLFALEYCLAQLWIHWGIKPDAMIGHSIGEYVAACIAGVFSLKDCLKLVAFRGKLMQSAQPGSMLAVPIPAKEITNYLSESIELAANNSTSLCVLSGNTENIIKVQKELEENDISATLLKTSHAFHSCSMEPIIEEFEEAVKAANPQPPVSPFISNLTGDWIKPEEAIDSGYWSQHLRRPVLFAAGVTNLLKDTDRIFLEVGPSSVLTQLVRQHERFQSSNIVIETLGGPKSEYCDTENIFNAMARLWIAGINPDWESFYKLEKRRRVSLPGYAFNRQRYWVDRDGIETDIQPNEEPQQSSEMVSLEYNHVIWKTIETDGKDLSLAKTILVIAYPGIDTQQLEESLRSFGATIISARFSDQYQQLDETNFSIRINSAEDYENLLTVAEDASVELILHCANIVHDQIKEESENIVDAFISPLYTLQAAVNLSTVSIMFLSAGAYKITGDESLNPITSLIAGPGLVAGLELPHLKVSALDVATKDKNEIVKGILKVQKLSSHQPSVYALRSDKIYSKSFESCTLELSSDKNQESTGCSFVTGGLSGLGFEVSKSLIKSGCKNIVLIGRTKLPSEESWQNWLETHGTDDSITNRIHKVQELEKLGAKVRYYAVDIASKNELAKCFEQILQEFGDISTVIHAAGEINDGPLLTKEAKDALAVLSSKVQGTLNLARFVKLQNIQNFLLFSSVSSLWGSPGQIDYVAANAFMDALIPEIQKDISGRALSINWSAWSGTGMTERLANPIIEDKAQIAHPLIDRCLYSSGGTTVYTTEMFAAKHWIINEHRAAGTNEPILPGTGFLEIVKAAFDPLVSQNHIQFTDVMFLSPFVLANEEPRELRVQFEPWALGTTFSVISQADPEDNESWFIHMKGRIGAGVGEKKQIDLDAISARCSDKQPHPNEQVKFLSFGPRWHTIESIQLGQGEALLELQLDQKNVDDVDTIWSHPGMMDVATAGALLLVDGYDSQKHFYVPIAYNRIEFFGAMPAKWISHIEYKAKESQPGDVVVFDVTISDESGNVLAIFEEFMLKCIEGPESLVNSRPPLSARINPITINQCITPNALLQERLAETGVDVATGIAAFNDILKSDIQGQLAISPGPINDLLTSITHQVVDQGAQAKIGQTVLDVTEVEKVLSGHEAVINSVVIAKEDRFGEINVAAFVQLNSEISTTVSELRRYARKGVDDQLVPSKIIELEEFPRSTDGEIDKSKLPDPFSADDDLILPSTEAEKLLTEIWQDILGVDQISITDNFFDLGGHSLLGVRLLASISKKTGVRLEDVVVVTYTLEQTAAELDKRMGKSSQVTDREQEQPKPSPTAEAEKDVDGGFSKFIKSLKRSK